MKPEVIYYVEVEDFYAKKDELKKIYDELCKECIRLFDLYQNTKDHNYLTEFFKVNRKRDQAYINWFDGVSVKK